MGRPRKASPVKSKKCNAKSISKKAKVRPVKERGSNVVMKKQPVRRNKVAVQTASEALQFAIDQLKDVGKFGNCE